LLSDNSLEDIKYRAREMGQFYFNDFGSHISCIAECVEDIKKAPELIQNQEKLDKKVLIVYECLEKVENMYERIPFEKLQGKNEYAPLLVTKKILSELHKLIDASMSDQNTLVADMAISDYCTSLITLGNLYYISLKSILRSIRSHPESNNFQILDGNGKVLDIF